MLRRIRVLTALLFWVCITLLFLDFTGTVHAWLGWMAKIQFLPAVLALNAGVVLLLVVLTLVFGQMDRDKVLGLAYWGAIEAVGRLDFVTIPTG